MAEVRIGDDVFHVELDGEAGAPVLMLSNSLGTDLRMWDPQMPEFTKHFHVVRYDSRGHGKSAAPEGPYSIEQLGQDALAVMDALGFEKVHWLGLSKGGMVGQWLLTHAPERIDRAVLANTSAHTGPPDGWNDRIRNVRKGGMEAISQGVVDRWFTPRFQDSDAEAVGKILDMLNATPPEGYLGCIAAIRDMDQREAIRSVDRPVLVIVGNEDPATPPDHGELIAANIPGAELVALDAAHLSNVEQPDAFTEAVVAFLTRQEEDFGWRHAAVKRAKKASKKTKVAKKTKAAKKTKVAKKAVKKAATKKASKASKKTSKKPAKKASKGFKKAAKKTIKKAVKKVAKVAKKAAKGAKSFARKSGRPVRGRTR